MITQHACSKLLKTAESHDLTAGGDATAMESFLVTVAMRSCLSVWMHTNHASPCVCKPSLSRQQEATRCTNTHTPKYTHV